MTDLIEVEKLDPTVYLQRLRLSDQSSIDTGLKLGHHDRRKSPTINEGLPFSKVPIVWDDDIIHIVTRRGGFDKNAGILHRIAIALFRCGGWANDQRSFG